MGKRCRIAKFAAPVTFSQTNPLAFRDLDYCQILYSNVTDLKQFKLVFPALSISGIHKLSGIKLKGG